MRAKIAIAVALLGAAIFGALITNLVSAQSRSPEGFTREQEQAIREIVSDYIEEHPDQIISAVEAYAVNERDRAVAAAKDKAADYLPTLLSSAGGFSAGKNAARAEVAVIEFFDYHCGFCKKATGLVRELTKSDPEVKVVFREFPILREESEIAARYALAAREQGKYAEFHFALMAASGTLTKERIKEIATDVGLDWAALDARQKSPAIEAAISENLRIAQELGLDGTPSFIVASTDGDYLEVIPGFGPEEIKAAIKEAKAQ